MEKNFVGELNEKSQIERFSFEFRNQRLIGAFHCPTIVVELYVRGEKVAKGKATTAKQARQVAALAYLYPNQETAVSEEEEKRLAKSEWEANRARFGDNGSDWDDEEGCPVLRDADDDDRRPSYRSRRGQRRW